MSQPYSTSDKSLMDNNYYQQYPQQQYPQQYTQPQYPQQYTQPQYPQQYTQPQYQQQQFPQEQQQYPNYSQQQNSSPGIDYSADVVYKDMSQKEWAEIQADKTEYSHYWDNPDAFKPETFSNNTTKETKWVNLPWTIAFWIQFLVSIGLFIYLIQVVKNNNKTSNSVESTEDELVDSVGKIFIYSFLIGLVTNIIHILYAIFCPKVYIQFGFWLSFAFILAITFLIYLFVPYYALFGFPGFIFFLAFIYYCICRQYIPFSTAVFSYSCSLIIKYPSILFFTTLTGIVVSVVEGLFTAMAILCFYSDLKYYYILFLWTLFSFFWTSLTFSYVGYMTGAGAAATAYFLDGTPQMPAHPVCSSFGRSVTSTFGAASLAGFILALIKFFRYLAEQLMESDNFIAVLIGCIIDCILCCIEAFVSFLNQYGLIYCATFGIPYQEGCRRFMELSSKKFVDVIFSGSIIDRAIGFNMFVFSLLAAVIGFGVGYAMYPNDYLFALIICIVSLVFAYGIFFIYEAPLEVYPNTIFVCFAECPEVLASKSHELSETIWQLYHTSVSSLTGQKIKSRRRKNK